MCTVIGWRLCRVGRLLQLVTAHGVLGQDTSDGSRSSPRPAGCSLVDVLRGDGANCRCRQRSEFLPGKTVSIQVGFTAGGGYDRARLRNSSGGGKAWGGCRACGAPAAGRRREESAETSVSGSAPGSAEGFLTPELLSASAKSNTHFDYVIGFGPTSPRRSSVSAIISPISSRHGAVMICKPMGNGDRGTGTATTGSPTNEIGCA